MTSITRPGGLPVAATPSVSPTLLYHKWHAYDDWVKFETKESRLPFLEQVAHAVNELTGGGRAAVYRAWHDRYLTALRGLGVERDGKLVEGATVWRLVMGFATNPALESGLTLHPLYGFPYLPGSSVRGLVRHVAEMGLLEGEREAWAERPEAAELPAAAARSAFLDECERVQALLGSLSIEPLDRARPPLPPRAVLKAWWEKRKDLSEKEAGRVRNLLELHAGGRVTFYDAVPAPGQEGLLQLDLLNPHYPEYYDNAGAHPPSDDQNPRPVYFLAVKPGARFAFPFRLVRLRGLSHEDARKQICDWLRKGLEEYGAGGKTAAGYGYFTVEGAAGSTTVAATGSAAAVTAARPGVEKTVAPPAPVDWKVWVRWIGMGEAKTQVPRMLQELSGEPRRLAARELLKKLKKNLRDHKYQNTDWVLRLREAAEKDDS